MDGWHYFADGIRSIEDNKKQNLKEKKEIKKNKTKTNKHKGLMFQRWDKFPNRPGNKSTFQSMIDNSW